MDAHPDPDAGEPLSPEAEQVADTLSLNTPPALEETPAEPTPPDDAPASAPAEGESPAPAADDPLHQLALEAAQHRLSPADEERATQLLKEALVDGRTGLTRAIDALPKLPWLVGVNAVSAVWQEMKPTLRTRLLAGLARVDSDAARRVRLSLARGLFKQDVPAALKIALSVAKDVRDKESGAVAQKDAHAFSNVFIGRAKPWVAQLPLADLKPNESDIVLHAAIMVVFGLPHPPVTQLGILKWGATAGRLGKLHPAALETITKGLARWNGKWRQALYTEVSDLPEEIAKLVAPPVREPRPAAPESPRESGADEAEHDRPELSHEDGDEDHAEDERDRLREQQDREDAEDDEAEERERAQAESGEGEAPRGERKERPVYESKTVPNQPRRGQDRPERAERPERPDRRGAFNLTDSLRHIEQYVNGLRQELQTAQNKLRQREDDGRRGKAAPNRPAPVSIAGEPTPDELARLNIQLEARNAELQALLAELREDAEARAASAEAAVANPADPEGAPLRALLQLKLQEDYDDFLALNSEAPDVVVQQHYRALLTHVFEVLRQEGVGLKEPEPKPQ